MAHAPTKDADPIAYLNGARNYLEVANITFTECTTRPDKDRLARLNSPLNFLFHLTIELALKAYLRGSGESIEGTPLRTHNLVKLYKRCHELGLKVPREEQNSIQNVINLLCSGNMNQNFRYFSLTSGAEAEVGWTHEVATKLVAIIAEALRPLDIPDGKAAKLIMRWSKPQPK